MKKKKVQSKKKNQLTLRKKISKNFYKYLPIAGLVLFLVYRSDMATQFVKDVSTVGASKNTQVFKQYKCAEDTPESEASTEAHDPYTFNSDIYSSKVSRPSATPNLIPNHDFVLTDGNTGAPTAFISNTEAGDATYAVQSEGGYTFLRVEQQTVGEQVISGSWLHAPVMLDNAKTYGASVTYRTTVDASILLELTMPDGAMKYQSVGLVKPSSQWKTYPVHIDNTVYNAASIRLIVTPVSKGVVDTRSYALYELPSAQLSQGIVSVTFDDGWESIYKAGRPLFKKYNIATTQYIVAENARNEVPGYMTLDEVKELAIDGHEIGSHSLRHCNLAKLSPQNVVYDAQTSKKVLTDAGLTVTDYAHPYGGYTDETVTMLRQQYSLLRSSDDGFNDRYFDPLNLRTKAIYKDTSIKEIQAWLNEARTNKQWLILMYHRIDETGDYTVSSKQLEQQLKMIHESGMHVMPVTKAAAAIR